MNIVIAKAQLDLAIYNGDPDTHFFTLLILDLNLHVPRQLVQDLQTESALAQSLSH